MKYAKDIVLILALFIHPVVPQTPAAYTMQGAAAHTTCLTPAVGSYFLCVANDGIWVSNNGAAYFAVSPPPVSTATSLTINGTTKTLPASFTISSGVPSVTSTPAQFLPTYSATAPAIAVQ